MRVELRIPDGLQQAYRAALAAQWEIRLTRGNHLKWTSPHGGEPVYTPSRHKGLEWRGTRNSLARLRRAGLEV